MAKTPLLRMAGLRRSGGAAPVDLNCARLATAAAVIILASPLPLEPLPGPKSMRTIAAVHTIATITVTIAGIRSPRRSFL